MSSDRPSCRKRLVTTAALAAFVLLAVGSSCRGFFVDQPNSITVSDASGNSTFSVAKGSTAQLKATGSFDRGTKDVTNSATWQSSSGCAPVGATGLVTGVAPVSSVTVTATLAGVSGTITGSVTGSGGSSSLTISPTTASLASGSVQFQALDSNSVDQAANATWTSSDTTILSFASSTGGLATLSNTGTVTVSASISSGSTCATGSASVTIQ
jgi:hypothetical protein